ncbi:MAG: hypothetical protein FRX49_04621 [Trebouxia sp. A1-2]|nr:MAG: hypothetical protein FRX49_04621 [Trebouxia sp. A1-2]
MAPTALDTLSPLPDSQIMQSGTQYLTQNSIDRLLGALLENIARNKPEKPVQWMIDVLSSSSSVEQAVQAASQARITHTFAIHAVCSAELLTEDAPIMCRTVSRVPEGQGNIQLSDLQAYTSRYGIASLPPSEVEQVFENIDAGRKNLVTADDFLRYMSKATCNMTDSQFQDMIAAMTQA